MYHHTSRWPGTVILAAFIFRSLVLYLSGVVFVPPPASHCISQESRREETKTVKQGAGNRHTGKTRSTKQKFRRQVRSGKQKTGT